MIFEVGFFLFKVQNVSETLEKLPVNSQEM